MENVFRIEGKIATMRDSLPVRFVHHHSPDSPDSHTLHINNYLEIYVYIRGDHKYIVGNKLYDLREGDIILINPRQVHKALPVTAGMYERFYLLVDVHCFDGLQRNPLAQLLHGGENGQRISPPEAIRSQVLKLLYTISDCFQKGNDRQVTALGCLLQLLDILNTQLQTQTDATPAPAVPELLEKILNFVAENTALLQTTAQIAQALGFTPQYLSAYFSRQIGTPLKTYLQAQKIALAKDLLDKGADVTAACFGCGFNDCSYFIRVFKKYVGMTPLRYKETLIPKPRANRAE